MKFSCFLMMMRLPPCHEGATDFRPDRFLLSVSSCTSSLANLHASSLLQPFQCRDKKGFLESDSFCTYCVVGKGKSEAHRRMKRHETMGIRNFIWIALSWAEKQRTERRQFWWASSQKIGG